MVLERVTACLPDRIEVLAVNGGVPALEHRGAFPVPPHLDPYVARERERLRQPGRYNERQAVLAAEPIVRNGGIVLPCYDMEYAVVAALRAVGQPPFVLSASVLLVCDETREIFVQRRSAFCDAAAGLLHTVSGAQKWPLSHAAEVALLETAWREVREETGICLGPDAAVPVVLIRERMATSFQFVLLGAPITAAQARAMHTSIEGDIVGIGFDALDATLSRPYDWAATGFFHVLLWLALDDGAGRVFGVRRAGDVMERALARTRGLQWPNYY